MLFLFIYYLFFFNKIQVSPGWAYYDKTQVFPECRKCSSQLSFYFCFSRSVEIAYMGKQIVATGQIHLSYLSYLYDTVDTVIYIVYAQLFCEYYIGQICIFPCWDMCKR